DSLFEPELLLGRIFDYLGVKSREIDGFKELEDEIVHFRKIRFIDGEKYEEIKRKIEEVRRYPERERELKEQYGNISREEYDRQMILFKEARSFEMKGQRIRIKYLGKHYYLPVIVSETEKIDYLNHIINVESEVRFLEELEEYTRDIDNEGGNNIFKKFDWWMFSKLDQTLDEIFIPYYNPKTNSIANFKPDFVFWAQKGNCYFIIFVDPKGTEHADGYRKIDGYIRIFGGKKQNREESSFCYGNLNIKTKLLFRSTQGVASVLENYREYWFDSLNDFADKVGGL
ncbi:MAG: restriction endonuclease subunit R, partial [Patescibacteria group bacterium]|nr:restriction endonuclease subunit R [Patescibacteria group bacterium]